MDLQTCNLNTETKPISLKAKLPSHAFTAPQQGCQIFLGATYQDGENIPKDRKIYQLAVKYTKWPQNVPNGHKMYQMAVKYTIILNRKTLPNLPKSGFLVCKYVYHLATLAHGVLSARVARFFLVQNTKKITNLPRNLPNVHKI
jgi:hypothetical protein